MNRSRSWSRSRSRWTAAGVGAGVGVGGLLQQPELVQRCDLGVRDCEINWSVEGRLAIDWRIWGERMRRTENCRCRRSGKEKMAKSRYCWSGQRPERSQQMVIRGLITIWWHPCKGASDVTYVEAQSPWWCRSSATSCAIWDFMVVWETSDFATIRSEVQYRAILRNPILGEKFHGFLNSWFSRFSTMTRFFDIIMLHLCIYVTHVGVVMLYNRLADLAKGQRQCPRCNCRRRLASRDQISSKVNKSNNFFKKSNALTTD